MEVLVPTRGIGVAIGVADIVRSCILTPVTQEPVPPEENIWVPVAPGIVYNSLPEAPAIIDTSPDQIIGCIEQTANNAQARLNELFPLANVNDGVFERSTNDIWVYDGAIWANVGPTPGPRIAIEQIGRAHV